MHLQEIIKKPFTQLSEMLEQLSYNEYTLPSKILMNATIGQHVRHIIELFIELEKGYETGTVNYDKRERNIHIETNRTFAKDTMWKVWDALNKENKPLAMASVYCDDHNSIITTDTNYYRELIYNLEHAIHHMALIKVGINEVSQLKLMEGFGVAAATIKYKASCAQ